MSNKFKTILRIDASARRSDSVSRALGDRLVSAIMADSSEQQVVLRNVADGLPFVDEGWITANFTPDGNRSASHRETLALSNALVAELQNADAIVITTPIYNFGVPATLKAWIDLVARAGVTFRYTQDGPVGLLEGKKAYVIVTSGGTPVGSDIDFASGYMRHVLGFIGITDVEIIAADQLMSDPNRTDAAHSRISSLAA